MAIAVPQPKQDATNPSLEDRVYLERVRLFFGHAVGNMLSALFGAMLLATVLWHAGTRPSGIAIWYAMIVLSASLVMLVEWRFHRALLNLNNVKHWVRLRFTVGTLISLTYGFTPLLLPSDATLLHKLYILLIFAGVVAIACTAYTTMPGFYLSTSAFVAGPMVLLLLLQRDSGQLLVALCCVLWLGLVLRKAWKVSQTSIKSIQLNEQLQDEIKSHKETKALLERMATHDSLTGLPNQRLLLEQLGELVKQGHRFGRKFAVMFIDLDGFKQINDRFGHQAGDQVLQEVANRLLNTFRETDIVARLGGDEYVIVYTDINDPVIDIPMLGDRLVNVLCKPVQLDSQNKAYFSASVGIAQFPEHGDNAQALISSADNAMYQVKAEGKNSYACAS